MKKDLVLFLSLAAFNLTSAKAAPALSASEMAHFEIANVVTEVRSIEDRVIPSNEGGPEFMYPGQYPGQFDNQQPTSEGLAIAQIALKIWDIIQDGAPIVNAQYRNASALPTLANNRWEALTGWRNERTITLGLKIENLYGMTTVDMEYQVKLIYGGRVKGKGKYIASARVVPTKVDVLWGFNLDVRAEVASVLNIATPEDPLASIGLDVSYTVSTILRSYTQANTYILQGDGVMKSNGKVLFDAARF